MTSRWMACAFATIVVLALGCSSEEGNGGDGGSGGTAATGGDGGSGGTAGTGGAAGSGGTGGTDNTGLIGPEGGVVNGEQGVTVAIPAGALSAEIAIRASVVDGSGLPARPSGTMAAGPFVALTPHGTQFAIPVEATLPYTPSSNSLTVIRIDDESDTTWEVLAGASFDGGTATIDLSHFSVLTVAAIGAGGSGGSGGSGTVDAALCISNTDCGAGEFCSKGVRCEGLGRCRAPPSSCEGVETQAICGCNGSTYDSLCHAQMAGVNRVPGLPGACCDDEPDCTGEFDHCNQYPLDGRCGPPTQGVCHEPFGYLPPFCEEPIAACGCDGEDIDCPNIPPISTLGVCECQENADCLPAEYCDAASCAGPGNCKLRVDPSCVETHEVAGCDGIIYANACDAAEAGVRYFGGYRCTVDRSDPNFPIITECQDGIPPELPATL